jgi:hypothetical protein
MDIAAVTGLFNSIGTAGIYLYACYYLMKRMEAKESERAAESREREARLISTLEHTETYIRETLAIQLAQNNQALQDAGAAMRGLARAFEEVPCRSLGIQDIEQARERQTEARR